MTQEDLLGSSVGADDQQPEDEAICLRQPRRDDDNTCAACEDMQASALKKLLKTQQVEGRSDSVAGWSKLLDECSSVLRPVLCQEDLPGSADGAEYQMPKERAIFLRISIFLRLQPSAVMVATPARPAPSTYCGVLSTQRSQSS